MSIAAYLREIGRGKDGARPLQRAQAADLMGQVLDGRVSDVEAGAFAIAMRIKGETPEELAGFMDAVAPRSTPLPGAPARAAGAVVLPSYNGARKLPNLTPLLALLLAREGLAVLVHGLPEDPGRITSAAIFEALSLPAVPHAAGVAARWSAGEPAFIATDDLHPSLARLLALRRLIGLRNPGHSLAKLLPAVPGAVRVVNHTHPEYAQSLSRFLALTGATALLMRGTEGEPVADLRRVPGMAAFVAGVAHADLSVPAQTGSLAVLPNVPEAIDAETTARFIERVMRGVEAVPGPIATQVRCLRQLAASVAPSSSADAGEAGQRA